MVQFRLTCHPSTIIGTMEITIMVILVITIAHATAYADLSGTPVRSIAADFTLVSDLMHLKGMFVITKHTFSFLILNFFK